MSNLRRRFKNKFQEKQNVPYTISGLLGNSTGAVKVPNRNNYVYVRLAGAGVAEVFNNRVNTIFDLPVICGYDPVDPQRFQVLSIQSSIAESSSFATGVVGYAPASRYQWMAAGGGQDPLFSELRQFMPLRITPTSNMSFQIRPQVVWTGSVWKTVGGSTEYNLTSYIPETEGKCCMVLVSIDTDGDVILTKGDEVNIADLVESDTPAPPDGTLFVLGTIRLYYGMPDIQEARTNTDVVDLRFPMWRALNYNELIGTLTWDDVDKTISDIVDITNKSHTSLTDIGTNTHDQIDTFIAGHTHIEADITNLDHDAQKIKGIPLNLSGLADGDGIIYDQGADEWIPGASSGGGGGGTSGDWLEFIDGALVVETDVGGTYIVPRNSTIEAVMIHCKDQGSTGSTIVDVNLNGTTIFTTQSGRPELAYDDVDGVATSGTPDVVTLVAGDILTIDIDQVATGAESLSFIVAMTVNPTSIGSLDDVDLTDIEDGDVLVWDDGDSKFVAAAQSGGSGVVDIGIVNGRLTLESGVPISTSNQSAKTTLYFTPYKGNRIALYDGLSDWELLTFSELSLDISGYTANKNYDIWAYNNSGSVALDSTIWTDDTTRATALTTQDGVYVKTGDTSRRYIGTIRINSTGGQIDFDYTNRLYGVWNYYNRASIKVSVSKYDPHTYASSSMRAWNDNLSANAVYFIIGVSEEPIDITANVTLKSSTTSTDTPNQISLGLNSSIGYLSSLYARNGTVNYITISARNTEIPVNGFNYVVIGERVDTGTSSFREYMLHGFIKM